MPWKLIFVILSIVVITCLIGFNLENKSNISLVFWEFEDVPVFMTMFCSFCVGILFSLPFSIGKIAAKNKEVKKWSSQLKMPKKKHEPEKKGTEQIEPPAKTE